MSTRDAARPDSSLPLQTPAAIYTELDRYVIGQHRAKRKLSIAAYNHQKRIALASGGTRVALRKANVLLYGPTGCGKTHLARQLSRILQVPFIIVDATDFTEAGYYGKDVETIIGELLLGTESVEEAQRGIVFIDEVDKIASRAGGARTGAGNRDIGGEGVQQALLKLLEGKVIHAPVNVTQHWNKHDFVQVDVTDVLFVCAGAFSDMELTVAGRVEGFGAPVADRTAARTPAATDLPVSPPAPTERAGDGSPARDAGALSAPDPELAAAGVAGSAAPGPTVEDFRRYGFSPEFLGRLPVRVGLQELTTEQLMQVLVEPPDAVLKEYRELLRIDEVDLTWDDDAFRPMARYVHRHKLGARVLRTLVEDLFEEVMFQAPEWGGRQLHLRSADVEQRLAELDIYR